MFCVSLQLLRFFRINLFTNTFCGTCTFSEYKCADSFLQDAFLLDSCDALSIVQEVYQGYDIPLCFVGDVPSLQTGTPMVLMNVIHSPFASLRFLTPMMLSSLYRKSVKFCSRSSKSMMLLSVS